jgi:OmpA-OmpF porin, OOP family
MRTADLRTLPPSNRGGARRRLRRVVSILCLTVAAASAAHADIESARELWRSLQDQESQVLAPKRHREAEMAMKALERSPDSEKALADAEKRLQVLDVAVRKARSLWPDLLELRERTRAAGAPVRDPRGWQEAENILLAAAQKLETGRTEAAQSQAREAIPAYKTARYNAMRDDLVGVADSLRATLKADKAETYVPRSWVRTVDGIAAAENLLRDRNEIDSDVRAAGDRAVLEARHARFLLDRIEAACDGKAPDRLETTILEWEEATRRVLIAMGLDATFESGLGPALAVIEKEGTELRSERDQLRVNTNVRAGTADSLTLRVQDLRDRLQDQKLQVAALDRSLASYRKLEDIQRMFLRNEGRVVVDGPDVVLRLHGLQFASGSADLPASAAPLLDKVVAAIKMLPGARVIVEGHTDSQGRAETNQQLSQDRALVVRDYLASHAGIDPSTITATGYGSSRPVASNDSAEGRALNRRIEVIISRIE